MDTTALIVEHASAAGIVGSAMPDVLARGQLYFGAKEMNPESVQQFLAGLRDTAPHLFAPLQPGPGSVPEEIPNWLSPSERATRYRQLHPTPPVSRKPQRYEPTPEQLKAWEGLSLAEQMTAYRQARDQQGQR
jgi:hypothetical protein